MMRTSTHYKGGFTGGVKVAHLAESHGMRAEVHGGGLTNLHLGLAIPNNSYYEDIVSSVADVKGKENGSIPFKNGEVWIPEDTVGIGADYDVEDFKKRAITTVSMVD